MSTTPATPRTEPPPIEQAERFVAQGRPALALEILRTMDRDEPRSLWAWARTLMLLGRHGEAIPALERIEALQPGDGRARAMITRIHQSIDAPEPAPGDGTGERPWATSIPPAFLHTIQNALHRYSYAGIPMLKNPFDLAIYTSLIYDLKPGLIVELGSKEGSSALWMAHQCDAFGLDTKIVSVDVLGVTDVEHPRIEFLEGDARRLDGVLGEQGSKLADIPRPWLVIDDADHAYETSSAIGAYFDPLLEPGDYLVFEDGIISDLAPEGHPGWTSGPHRAIRELLETDEPRYEIDAKYCDMFGTNVTWCTNGILKRTR